MKEKEKELKEIFLEHVAEYIGVDSQKLIKQLADLPASRLFESTHLFELNQRQKRKMDELKETLDLYNTFVRQQSEKVFCGNPQAVYDLLAERIRYEKQENFFALYVNTQNELIELNKIAVGTVDCCIARPQDIFRGAFACGAASIIVAHNHPSGAVKPSPQDLQITQELIAAGKIMKIPIIDHVILGRNNFTSLKELGCFDKSLSSPAVEMQLI